MTDAAPDAASPELTPDRVFTRARLQLVESALDLFGPLGSPLRDLQFEISDLGASVPAAQIQPPWFVQNTKRGETIPAYRTEHELRLIRDRSRVLAFFNEFAICGLENRVNYVVGDGFKYSVAPVDPKSHADRDAAARVNDLIDVWEELNDLPELEADALKRLDKDGEFFVRRFPDGKGFDHLRFVEPEHVTALAQSSADPAMTFGVETDAADVETVHGYWVVDDPVVDPVPRRVPAKDIVHVKLNTDRTSKRGLPTYFPVESNFRRCRELLSAMSTVAKIRAKIALIRKVTGLTSATADAVLARLTTVRTTDAATGETMNVERLRNGTVLTASGGTDYEMPSAQLGASDIIEVLQAELRAIASRLQMPEWMFTAVADAKYSNAFVVEAPTLKTFRRLQRKLRGAFGLYRYQHRASLLWRQLRQFVRYELITEDDLRRVTLQCEAPSLEARDKSQEVSRHKEMVDSGFESRATAQRALELDPDVEGPQIALETVGERRPVTDMSAVAQIQAQFYAGQLPRAAAAANLQLVCGFTREQAEALLPLENGVKRTDDGQPPAGDPGAAPPAGDPGAGPGDAPGLPPGPGGPAPGDPVPGDPVPGDPVPGDPVPGDPVPVIEQQLREAGFTGTITDSRGRKYTYVNGKRVKAGTAAASAPPAGAATKPAATKPAATKPAASKPAASKPATPAQQAKAAAAAAAAALASGKPLSPADLTALPGHLKALTVADLKALRQSLKVSGTGKVKADHIQALVQHATGAATPTPTSPPPAPAKPAAAKPAPTPKRAAAQAAVSAVAHTLAAGKPLTPADLTALPNHLKALTVADLKTARQFLGLGTGGSRATKAGHIQALVQHATAVSAPPPAPAPSPAAPASPPPAPAPSPAATHVQQIQSASSPAMAVGYVNALTPADRQALAVHLGLPASSPASSIVAAVASGFGGSGAAPAPASPPPAPASPPPAPAAPASPPPAPAAPARPGFWSRLLGRGTPPAASRPAAGPPTPLFTGVDANGHHWVNGKQVAKPPDETHWETGKPQSGASLNGVDFKPAPPKFWEKTKDVDIGEPKPIKRIDRVSVMIQEPDGRIWIVQPTNEYGNRKFTLAGGGVEPGLTDQQNALKEVWEETGLQVEITGHLGDFEDANNGNNGRLYIGRRVGGAPWDAKVESHIIDRKTGKPAAESSAVSLVTPEKAAALLHRSDDLAQLMTLHPPKVDTPTRGKGSEPIKKFIAAIQPKAKAFLAAQDAKGALRPGNADLHAVQEMRGFNKKPTLVTKNDMDTLIAKGGHIEMLRGVGGVWYGPPANKHASGQEVAEEFRTGDHYPGFGVFGSGTYADSNKGSANVASQYASGGGLARGGIIRMALPKTAKIISVSELEAKVPQPPESFKGYPGSKTPEEDWLGVQAAIAGYDAIYVDGKSKRHGAYGKGFYVVLNRGALVVQKEDATGHQIK